jgi:photosystem II stability/assembly factor-like uncharacterized protein
VKTPVAMMFVLAELVSVGYGQDPRAANTPFTLTWSEGKCLRCKIAVRLGEIQFVSRREVWAVGSEDHLGGVNTVIVHSTDAGRTWREVPRSQHYTDPDAQQAFSFLNVARGWVVSENLRGEPQIISTRDGGQHWQRVSRQFLNIMQFVDGNHGYGTTGDGFFRTDDGGRSWVETKIADVTFVEQMVFLTPDNGWIATTTGMGGKDFLVFRTVNGGSDWEEFRTTPPQPPERIRDLVFVDQHRGWLTIWNFNGEGTCVFPRLTEEGIGRRILIYRFKGRTSLQT